MKHIYYLLVSLLLLGSCQKEYFDVFDYPYEYTGKLGDIVKIHSDQKLTIDQITPLLPNEVNQYVSLSHGIRVVRLDYTSESFDGKTIKASGTIIFPDNKKIAYPIISYQHGTTLYKKGVPSTDTTSLEYLLNVGLTASSDVIVCVPDYFGLGTGEGEHNYLNSEEEANSVRDLIRAARKLIKKENQYLLNEDIYLFGYSQGGHATLAAQKKMELKHPREFKLKATAPMAGPYALSKTNQFDMLFQEVYYPNPFYFPYILKGLINTTPNYISSFSQILKAPYDEKASTYITGQYNFGDVNSQFDHYIHRMIKDELKDEVKNNPNHPLRLAAQTLDLVEDWTPKTPMRLYHCNGDRDVYIENSIYADSVFRSRGANIELVDVGEFNHYECAPYAMLLAKLWFDTFLNE